VLGSSHDVVAFLSDTVRRATTGDLPRGFGAFPLAYHAFTLEMLAQLTAGGFDDPVWVSDFIVRFATRYEVALGDRRHAVWPWRIAFERAERRPRSILSNLLLGINAHMSYDLCAVLVALLEHDDPSAREHDVRTINRVIEHGIGPVQRAVIDELGSRPSGAGPGSRPPGAGGGSRPSRAAGGGYLGWADALGLGLDELATWTTFVRWRGDAWTQALAILDGTTTLAAVERRVGLRSTALRVILV